MATTADWTFMIYMDSPGDEQLQADRDLLARLAKLKPWSESFNLVYDIGVGEERERGHIVADDADPEHGKLEPLQRVPRRGPIAAAITSFVDWAEEIFPSRFTALSLRDHGSTLGREDPLVQAPRARGWLMPHASSPRPADSKKPDELLPPTKVSGNGESRGGHFLNGRAIRDALTQTKKGSVDVYCFDACAMGMLEFAYEVRKVAKYVIAAELIILVTDFPYEAAIKAGTDVPVPGPLGMATAIAKAESNLFAVVDTGWVETLADAVGELGKRLNAQSLDWLINLRGDIRPTADSGVDLKVLLDAIVKRGAEVDKSTVEALVTRVRTALERTLRPDTKDATTGAPDGLALSFPKANTIGYMLGYGGLAFGDSDWARFLFNYIPMCINRSVAQNAPAPPSSVVPPGPAEPSLASKPVGVA